MLKKINIALLIAVILGAVLIGGFYAYSKLTEKGTIERINQELGG